MFQGYKTSWKITFNWLFNVCMFLTCYLKAYHSSSDPPISVIKLGSPLKKDLIEEGHDVYFECQSDANPPTVSIRWNFNASD